MKRRREDTKKPHEVKEEVIPDISSQIADYKSIELTIFELLEKNNLPELVTLIFALLRDRPYLLVHLYQLLIKKTNDRSVKDDQKKRIQYILSNVFTKLWFISFKVSFPKEMIAMFEIDYITKRVNSFHNTHKEISSVISKIYRTFGNDASININELSLTNLSSGKRLSAIYYYYDFFIKPSQNNDEELLKLFNLPEYHKNLKSYYTSSMDSMDWMSLMYNKDMEYNGLQIKMRRILIDVKSYIILGLFYKLSVKIIDMIGSVFIGQLEEIYMSSLLDYSSKIEESEYDMNIIDSIIEGNIVTMNIDQKMAFFNKFSVFNNIFDEILRNMPDNKKAEFKVLCDNFYIEIGARNDEPPDFLMNIVLKVEKEISFPDEKAFYYYFRDDENDNILRIDTQYKYAWLYEYYDKDSGTIKKLNGEELVKMESKLSNFWYNFTRYKLSLYSPNKQLMFSNKI